MKPTIERIEKFIKNENPHKAWKEAFNQIYRILIKAKNYVEAILEKRKAIGEIQDIRQSMKSIAGNTFSNAMIYIF